MTADSMIFQEAMRVTISNTAPNRIITTDVSPMDPGMMPIKASQAEYELLPVAAISPKAVAPE